LVGAGPEINSSSDNDFPARIVNGNEYVVDFLAAFLFFSDQWLVGFDGGELILISLLAYALGSESAKKSRRWILEIRPVLSSMMPPRGRVPRRQQARAAADNRLTSEGCHTADKRRINQSNPRVADVATPGKSCGTRLGPLYIGSKSFIGIRTIVWFGLR
jgi:hypothetical protein